MALPFWLLGLLLAMMAGYWWLVILAITWISYWYSAIWIFLIAVLFDAYFGAYYAVPLLSLYMGAFVLFVEVLKIQLRETPR